MKKCAESKHLVIFTPIVQWPVHFETDLEIAQRHLDEGYKVTFLHCRGAFPVCAQNPEHSKSVCHKCVSRFEKGISWLGKDCVAVKDFQCLTEVQRNLVDGLSAEQFASVEEIRKYTVEGARIGLAAFGSVVSFLREPKPDLPQSQTIFTAYLKTAAISYFSIGNQLSSLAPDEFVLFNGRFAELRAALFAAQSLNVPTYVHERAGVLDRYSLLYNTSTHDIAAMKEAMDSTYQQSALSEADKVRVASEWYEARRSNKAQSWYSFTDQQVAGLLPDFANDHLNLVIFNSSDDEIESFEDWRNPFYLDQNEGIERICADLHGDKRFKIFLRVHPNLKNIDNSQTKGIERIGAAFPQLTVIPADSQMSTYGILDACDIILVFGSTIGIEAVYSGKPSFLVGKSFYEDLCCCVTPGSHEDLMSLLSCYAEGDRMMMPSPEAANLAVAKFGFFQQFWGNTYKYVRPCHVGKSVMTRDGKETSLRPSLTSWIIDKAVTFFTR